MSLARLRLILFAVLAAGLIPLAGATTASAAVPGGIQSSACLGGAGCTTVANLGTSDTIAVSPDGDNVYVATEINATTWSLLTFDRNSSGQLTLKDCIRSAVALGCRTVTTSNLNDPSGLAVTGNSVYVANRGNSTILEFDRDDTGFLRQKTLTPCISNSGGADGCADTRVMVGPERLVVSGDGKHLYVASSASGSIGGFTIGSGGGLTHLDDGDGQSGCVDNTGAQDCHVGKALNGMRAISISPDDRFIYAASRTGKSIAVITRNLSTGRLAMSSATNGCLVAVATTGCTTESNLTNAGQVGDIAVGRGGELFVTLTAGDVATETPRVVTFDPDNGGLDRRNNTTGCVHNTTATATCALGRGGLAAPTGIATSADGEDVYVSGGASGGVVELNRDGNGVLTSRVDSRGCVASVATAGCITLATLGTPDGIAASPDGRHVYVTSSATGRISVLRRDSSSPVCTGPTHNVTHGTVGPLSFGCSDPDGDALTFAIVNPPTLGSLGALDNNARTFVYAAPQGQNGSTSITFNARYASTAFGAFDTPGAVNVNVVGAPAEEPPPVIVAGGIDADGDGFFAGQECNDGNAAIRPGALEVKGNRVDENCDGIAEPFQNLPSGVVTGWTPDGSLLRLGVLQITQQFPRGLAVEIRCKGPKCRFKTKKLKLGKLRRGTRSVLASLSAKQRVFRAGQTVEVWVSAPGFNVKVNRYVLRKGKIPPTQPFCVIPGERTPRRTCT